MTSLNKRTTPTPARKKLVRNVSILGTGSFVPPNVVTNEELSKIVDTSDEWITTRTGIKERHIAGPDLNASDLGFEASKIAIAEAGIRPEQINLIIVATITPDMPFPATACLIQQKLGIKNCACFDIEVACSGFLYAMEIAQQFVSSGTYDYVLIIGTEKLSSIVDWQDRNTCVLFGDGAGAAVVGPWKEGHGHGILTTQMGADGSQAEILQMPAGGSRMPASEETLGKRLHFLQMAGKEVFKNAVTVMGSVAREALANCELTINDINCIIPHQANVRIIEALAERLEAPREKIFVNLQKYGNMSAASVAVALDEAVKEGRVKRGDYVLLVVFGAGLTWASAVIQW